jgi:hypothetical protein
MTEPVSRPLRTSSRASVARSAEDLGLAEPVPYPDASDETRIEPDRESPPGTPRWVKALGIIAIVLILAFAGLHLTGNAPAHMPGSSTTEHGMQAP